MTMSNLLKNLLLDFALPLMPSYAFEKCTNLRILSIPSTINSKDIGFGIILGCSKLFRTTQIKEYKLFQPESRRPNFQVLIMDNGRVNQDIIDFHCDLPQLYKLCLDTNVSAQIIRQYMNNNGHQAAYHTDYWMKNIPHTNIRKGWWFFSWFQIFFGMHQESQQKQQQNQQHQ